MSLEKPWGMRRLNSVFLVAILIAQEGLCLACNLICDDFLLLVIDFRGKKVYKWKVEFIKAFNAMEKML